MHLPAGTLLDAFLPFNAAGALILRALRAPSASSACPVPAAPAALAVRLGIRVGTRVGDERLAPPELEH